MLKIQRKGGEKAKAGTYWDASSGERVRLEKAGALPGDSSRIYLRFHPAAMLIVGPVMGLLYAIFMPLAAILMVIWAALDKLVSSLIEVLPRAADFIRRRSEELLTARSRRSVKLQNAGGTQKGKGRPH